MTAPPPPPLLVVLAAPPDAPGAAEAIDAALDEAREGLDVRLLLTEDGLAAVLPPWPERIARAGASAALCARSARTRGLDPAAVPAHVAWSSLAAFLRDVPDGARVWSVFP